MAIFLVLSSKLSEMVQTDYQMLKTGSNVDLE